MSKNRMSYNEMIEKLGDAGEKIVGNYYNRQKKLVEHSVNHYDREKDFMINGRKVEVKTQVPYCMKDGFSFRKNQLWKCTNADDVIFVSVPNKTRPHWSDGKVYIANPKEMQYSEYTVTDKKTGAVREMILIKINQPAITELFEMTDEECKLLQEYSPSSYN